MIYKDAERPKKKKTWREARGRWDVDVSGRCCFLHCQHTYARIQWNWLWDSFPLSNTPGGESSIDRAWFIAFFVKTSVTRCNQRCGMLQLAAFADCQGPIQRFEPRFLPPVKLWVLVETKHPRCSLKPKKGLDGCATTWVEAILAGGATAYLGWGQVDVICMLLEALGNSVVPLVDVTWRCQRTGSPLYQAPELVWDGRSWEGVTVELDSENPCKWWWWWWVCDFDDSWWYLVMLIMLLTPDHFTYYNAWRVFVLFQLKPSNLHNLNLMSQFPKCVCFIIRMNMYEHFNYWGMHLASLSQHGHFELITLGSYEKIST